MRIAPRMPIAAVLASALLGVAAAPALGDGFPVTYTIDRDAWKQGAQAGQTLTFDLHDDAACTNLVDTMTLGTLGLTSLLLTVGGYWAGRFGEATSNHQNQRARILIAVTALTVGVEIGALVVHVFLGDAASLGTVLGRVLLPSLALNVVLAVPAYWLMRKLFPPTQRREREVVALG